MDYPPFTTASSKSPASVKYRSVVHGGKPAGLRMKITPLSVSHPLFLLIPILQIAAYKRRFSGQQPLYAVLLRVAIFPTQYFIRHDL